uniref:Uncharacterized protein n=1 Tax=Triticum urartu TaxID=4572 RepID=A0A8R7U1F1_TRIUA
VLPKLSYFTSVYPLLAVAIFSGGEIDSRTTKTKEQQG